MQRHRWDSVAQTPARPRKHIERIVIAGDGNSAGEDQEARELRLGAWIGNQHSRAATLNEERMELLSALGMRWG